jgi:flagellar biogenesis protein FliO
MSCYARTLVIALAGWLLTIGAVRAQSSVQSSAYSRPAQPRYSSVQPRESPYSVQQAVAAQPLPNLDAPAPLKLAPRNAAAKRELGRPAAPSPSGAIGTVVGGLAIVLGLFIVLAWCSKRFAPAGAAALPKEAIELLGRTPLTTSQQMQLVRVGNKLLVVAVSTTGAETLTEITDPTEVERLATLCRRGQPASASTSFSQVLGQIASEPARGGFAGETRPRSRGAS